jgi:hypothetical protein
MTTTPGVLVIQVTIFTRFYVEESFHHQPINVPTAGAQAFLMDYPQGERAITHHAGPVRIGGWVANDCKYSRDQRLNVPSEARVMRSLSQ